MAISQSTKAAFRDLSANYMPTATLLESLLDINPQKATEILDNIKNLSDLKNLSIQQMRERTKTTERQARILCAAAALSSRFTVATEYMDQISCPQDAANILSPILSDLKQEELHVLLLNTRNRVIERHRIYCGTVNSSNIRPAEVLRPATIANAPAIIMAHNHPSGDPEPSPEDIKATQDVIAAGKILDIAVLDHVVIGAHPRYVSMKEKGLAFPK